MSNAKVTTLGLCAHLFDDAMADLAADGVADHAALDLDNDGSAEAYVTDDGTGTWAVTVDRSGQPRWFGLDGVEHTGGPMLDFDGEGQAEDRDHRHRRQRAGRPRSVRPARMGGRLRRR
jgi:hypothetical protein